MAAATALSFRQPQSAAALILRRESTRIPAGTPARRTEACLEPSHNHKRPPTDHLGLYRPHPHRKTCPAVPPNAGSDLAFTPDPAPHHSTSAYALEDGLKVPANIPAGDYVLGYRWYSPAHTPTHTPTHALPPVASLLRCLVPRCLVALVRRGAAEAQPRAATRCLVALVGRVQRCPQLVAVRSRQHRAMRATRCDRFKQGRNPPSCTTFPGRTHTPCCPRVRACALAARYRPCSCCPAVGT